MKNILFISLLFLSLTACKKKELTFSMSGVVTDATFGQALNGASLTLLQKPAGGGTMKVVGSSTIGSDGKFQFTFKREQAEKFFIQITKEKYFDVYEPVSYDSFSTEKELVRNYSTTAKSWVKLHFKNVAPSAVSDILKWTKQAGKANCPTCCDSEQHVILGEVDTTFKFISDGNTPFSYLFNASNPTTNGIKNVNTVAFDTVTLLLEY
ncbi:MAG: hypothetical protein PHQ74_08030 [Crocinitomicaceae bacterium]|nr:hypothetical protein [Crocinitomicaceae bacterium]